ncbi:MAG: TIGR00341 family protein [Gammaproteobacteria bacterium]
MKIIEIITDEGHVDTILSIAEQFDVTDHWHYQLDRDDRHVVRMLVSKELIQSVLDASQKTITSSENSRIVVMPVEATMPRVNNTDSPKKSSKNTTSREELYQSIERNTRMDQNYILLVVLSTIVAAVGMLEDSVAIVIGAMVIAPLLGPNIALAFGTVLGDSKLMLRALMAILVGILVALITAFFISLIYPLEEVSKELSTRTVVGLSSVVMALASGAAAALSMTTGLSTVLVGVMVAVAILPPTAALGLMLGYHQYLLAFGAFILLAVNIVCINISANIVFIFKGINPRTSGEKRKAKKFALMYLTIWLLLLASLLVVLVKLKLYLIGV